MKCKKCGLKLEKGELLCPQCGTQNKKKSPLRILVRILVILVVIAAAGAGALIGFDRSQRKYALIPEIYAGMTKQELYAALKTSFNGVLYDGKVLENPNVPAGADTLSYVAYAPYCNAIGLNRPMELEVVYITVGGQQYVDSYTISLPYEVSSEDENGSETVTNDLRATILPLLEGKYGSSDDAAEFYAKQFGVKQSATVELCTTDQLLDIEDYQQTDFKDYDGKNYCCRITYTGYSFANLRQKLGI